MVPFADTTPPASMVKVLLDGQVPWVLKAGRETAAAEHPEE